MGIICAGLTVTTSGGAMGGEFRMLSGIAARCTRIGAATGCSNTGVGSGKSKALGRGIGASVSVDVAATRPSAVVWTFEFCSLPRPTSTFGSIAKEVVANFGVGCEKSAMTESRQLRNFSCEDWVRCVLASRDLHTQKPTARNNNDMQDAR